MLTAILAIPAVNTPINSVEDLVSQNELGWAMEGGSILEQMGKQAANGTIFHKLYDKGVFKPSTCHGTMDKIKAGVWGEVCEGVTIQKVLSDDFTEEAACNFYIGTEPLMSTAFAMAFRTRSPYLPEVNSWIMLSLQMGIQTSWIKALMPNATRCDTLSKIVASKGKTSHTLVVYELAAVFGMFVLGLGMAVPWFGVEMISRIMKRRDGSRGDEKGRGRFVRKGRDIVPLGTNYSFSLEKYNKKQRAP